MPLPGCPLDEKISEMHLLRREGRRDRRARDRLRRQPDVPGDRTPDLQRLHEGLHLSEAGAGQHSPDRNGDPDRRAGAALGRRDLRPADALESALPPPGPSPCPTTARRSWSSGSGPAGYTLAHYLVNEGFGVVGIDGLKIEPLPADWTRLRRQAGSGRSGTGRRSSGPSTSGPSPDSAGFPSTESRSAGTRTS